MECIKDEKPMFTNKYENFYVTKRDGTKELVSKDKITSRIFKMCKKVGVKRVDPIKVVLMTLEGLTDGIKTSDLDTFAAQKCADKIREDYEYNILAAGLCISNLHKMTSADFMEITEILHTDVDKEGNNVPIVPVSYYNYVKAHIERINAAIDYEKDYLLDFFSIKTFERAYLQRIIRNGKTIIVERPQQLFMRVSLGIHQNNIDDALESYKYMSNLYFTHASPTLYNAGTCIPQCSSCFLLGIGDDTEDIFESLKNCAKISKTSGGIGMHITSIRGNGSIIKTTRGKSLGIVPLAKTSNDIARWFNQGGRRKGAFALYVEPWHTDIFEFCELKKNTGAEEMRARDLFLGLWIPDLFMERVKNDEMWSLMCPDTCKGLEKVHSKEFNELYRSYEERKMYTKQVKARDLWFHILECQWETGVPYMLYKDHANSKSNQKNLGTIRSSNLCCEIIQYSDDKTVAVCNLASLCLPRYVIKVDGEWTIDYELLANASGMLTINLDNIIDINYYAVPAAKQSNIENRPIGIGVQGLANVYAIMEIPFDSEEARIVNKKIFETIYWGACNASHKLAVEKGAYKTFAGSPFSEGKLQFDMWENFTKDDLLMGYDWDGFKEKMVKDGMRNSLLTAPMPTATTSQLMCNTEAFEPITSNIYTRSTLAGEYIVINNHLQEKLIELGLWTTKIINEFIYDNGSIQNIKEIPQRVKDVYKTAFDMKMFHVVQQAIDRAPFVDQSQSMNIFMDEPDFVRLTSSHFYGWEGGLKTGMYYLRSKPASNPIKFGLDPEEIERIQQERGLKKYDINDLIDDAKQNNDIDINDEITVSHKFNRIARLKPECESCSA